MGISIRGFAGIALATMLGIGVIADSAMAAATPMFPPPGGVTFVGSGNSGRPGGRTNSYSNFSPADLPYLYWGKWDSTFVGLSMDGNTYSGAETMVFAGFVGNTATWTGASQIPQTSGPAIPVNTRLTLTLAGNVGSWDSPLLHDVALTADTVADVNGDFTANILFEAKPVSSSSWTPYLDLFDATPFKPAGVQAFSNFSGAFYVPEPSGLALLALGAAAMGVRRRRTV